MDDGKVAFLWKDYQHGATKKTMTLETGEVIRRFLLHVLPEGFQHIRHFGFLTNRYREAKLVVCRQLLGTPVPINTAADEKEDYRDLYQRLTGNSLRDCPICGRGHMLCIETFAVGSLPRAPPPQIA